jgi:phage host-nuclease inhibitor protein Gam
MFGKCTVLSDRQYGILTVKERQMAVVDFSLADVRQVVKEEAVEAIEASELRITTAVRDAFAEYEQKYDAKFAELTTEVKAIRQLVGQHSREIMELKARNA